MPKNGHQPFSQVWLTSIKSNLGSYPDPGTYITAYFEGTEIEIGSTTINSDGKYTISVDAGRGDEVVFNIGEIGIAELTISNGGKYHTLIDNSDTVRTDLIVYTIGYTNPTPTPVPDPSVPCSDSTSGLMCTCINGYWKNCTDNGLPAVLPTPIPYTEPTPSPTLSCTGSTTGLTCQCINGRWKYCKQGESAPTPTQIPYTVNKNEVQITNDLNTSTGYTATSDSTQPPTVITGTVTQNGVPIAYGTTITALVNGEPSTSVTTKSSGSYTLNVIADSNDKITFNVNGSPSAESITLYDFGSILNLDLTIGNDIQSAIISPLGSNLIRVFNFNNATKNWSFYDPDPALKYINSLNAITPGSVYWIKIRYDTIVNLNGSSRNLYSGWNLVSY